MAAIKAALVGRPTAKKRDGRHSNVNGSRSGLGGCGHELRALHEIVVREAIGACNCALNAWKYQSRASCHTGKHCMR